ncbi:hypothetical protein SAMN04515667_0570 [Formosa sp. Hel1_31_208]|uniref:hypothetical protein n=1 Tax=Formosa sp. Hel1_31_208 TaxID=1798225 RepID=UPI00087AB34F|nr:hypothetical protein [Formosa sp. Hel1_31_208]SDR75916.1 hypothetical protein SAMN04515667_0570 [Formosa sp. Hel1_31_208]
MAKLSKDNIQFIENYLENSEVFYADIRMEMTDHVASAIEKRMADNPTFHFYDVFKDYMIEQKTNLLENNKQFLRNSDKTILKELVYYSFKPSTFLVFCIIFLGFYQLVQIIDVDSISKIVAFFPILSVVPFVIIYIIALQVFKLSRFSGIERMGFVYIMSFQVFNLISILLKGYVNEQINFLVLTLYFSLTITLSLILIRLSISVINYYRKHYKFLV